MILRKMIMAMMIYKMESEKMRDSFAIVKSLTRRRQPSITIVMRSNLRSDFSYISI